jgi:assimilatory nitrate reductase catalytic subunit
VSGAVTNSLLREWHGPLTRDLVLEPAAFGLGRVPARLQPDATATTVCGFCSTGCGLNVHLKNNEAINLTATPDYPVNLGMACPKGWEALAPLSAPDRATTPLRRNVAGELEPIDWDAAMQLFTLRFKAIQDQFGADSIAWLGSGQICTEELALLGALGKFGMGMIHGDGNTRQCMATAVSAYKESFGFDAPPFTYADFEQSDVIVLIGSNLCIAHPILWQRVLRNRNQPQILVIDPRKTETAMAATQHLALRPKSDLVLLYGIANLLVQNDWLNHEFIRQHTTGFESFVSFVRDFTPDRVAADTGLTIGQLYHFAEAIHRGKAVSFWWTMGVNQGHEGTRTAQAVIDLALMTGNIGRPGTGANSITGQCNAMGSRLYSNTTNLLGGHDFLDAGDRYKVAGILGLPVERIPSQNSWAYDEILDGVNAGKIKGLWIIGTNTAHSWIDQSSFHELRRKLDFLVVQDMFHSTDTARIADLVLPAAAWGEKEGTFINSERRIGLTRKVARAPGEALSDFNIFKLVAHYWGCADLFREWTSPQAVFQIIKRLSAGQPCDINGIRDYRHLDECGGIQWPWAEGVRCEVSGVRFPEPPRPDTPHLIPDTSNLTPDTSHLTPSTERRLFSDGRFFTPDGKARFIFEAPRPVPEPVDDEYPFTLLTGRGTSVQWHTGTRTEKSDVLRQLRPAGIYVELHPHDAQQLGLAPDGAVRVRSRRGSLIARAFITPTIQPGQVFIPMHYVETNRLTIAAFDPNSRQPAYKACAVQLEKVRKTSKRKAAAPLEQPVRSADYADERR